MTLAGKFAAKGIPIVGVPKTIDNDLADTNYSFGFDTAVSTATEAVDKLHSTASAHQRVFVVEVMGRYVGWIALHTGLTGSADGRLFTRSQDVVGRQEPLLGGIGEWVAREVGRRTGKETRALILGHLQRGGSPTTFDRLVALRFGAAAVRFLAQGLRNVMVAYQPPEMIAVPLEGVGTRRKTVPLQGDTLRTCRDLGICLGEA